MTVNTKTENNTVLNKRIQKIQPSATLAVKAAANKLIAQGKKIYNLATGEPDIDTPQFIKDACITALNDGNTKYTDVPGIIELREALAEKFTKENEITTSASEVIVTNGGKQALYAAMDVILEDGDEVIIPAPYWVSYPQMVEMCHGVSVIVKCGVKDNYKLTPEALENAITPKTKMLILNSPSNPTGVMYSKEEMIALGEVIKAHNIFVLSDEVYEKITFGDVEFISFANAVPALKDKTITINAFSKAFSMTGWRIGYATATKEIVSAMNKHQSQITSNISSFSQYGALAAIRSNSDEFFKEMSKNFKKRFELCYSISKESNLLDVPVKPDGAFYLFLRIDKLIETGKIKNSTEFSTLVMEKAGVATVPGVEFGDDGAIRLATATSEEILKSGMSSIVEFVNGL